MPGVHPRFSRPWAYGSYPLAALMSPCYFEMQCRPRRLSLFVTRLPRWTAWCQPAASPRFDSGSARRRRGFGKAAFQGRAWPLGSAWSRLRSGLGRRVTRRCRRPKAFGSGSPQFAPRPGQRFFVDLNHALFGHLSLAVTPLPRWPCRFQPAGASRFDWVVPAQRRGFGQAAFQALARLLRWLGLVFVPSSVAV